ncbi:MAG: TolC family protein [Pseudomonadota bacterium]
MKRFMPIAGLLALAGCVSPSIPEVDPAAGIPLAEDYFAGSRPPSGIDDVWWRGFASNDIDGLVTRALERNQSLEAARQRLLAAQAFVVAEESDFYPDIDLQGSLDGSLDDGGAFSDTASLSLGGIWRIDLNGRLSAERAAALAGADR